MAKMAWLELLPQVQHHDDQEQEVLICIEAEDDFHSLRLNDEILMNV